MMFAAPWLAGLAALGAVPLLIWLLNRNRYRVVEWPALEFLLATVRRSSRRLHLRELILLLLRTMAVVLIALALARPSLAGGDLPGLGGGVRAVIVLDHSLSMAVREGAETRLDLAKARARELIGRLPRGSSAALVLMSDTASAEIPEPSQDLAYVAKLIGEAPQSDGGTAIGAGLGRAVEILAPGSGRREIYLITDLQAKAWPDAQDGAWRRITEALARPGAPALFIAGVGDGTAPADVQVASFAAADDIVTTEAPTMFTVRIVNHGGVPVPDLAVELWTDRAMGGELRQVAATSVRVDQVDEVRLEARLDPGIRRVQVRISPDRLPDDDRRQVVVEAVDKLRVLVVDAGAGATFIKAALAPQALSGQPDADLFRVDVLDPASLASADLTPYQAVVLDDLAAPPPGLGGALRSWVAGGHGLILLPGAHSQPAAWNQGFAGLAPATLAASARDLVDAAGATGQGLAAARLVHPIVAFFAAPEHQPFLAQPRFWRAWPLEPARDASVVAGFADGAPALVERGFGRGAVLISAFPCDKAWSDLPLRPAFLMLLRRIVQHVALGTRPHLNVAVHEALRLDLPSGFAGATVEALDPRGVRTRLNPSTTADGSARVELGDTPQAGFYRFDGADRPWSFAVNPPEAESDLTAISHAEAGARLAPATPVWIGAGEDAGTLVDRARSGAELWPLLFALAVACLAAESVLVAWWTPRNG